jgi:hydroxyacylglutathione hydrolase
MIFKQIAVGPMQNFVYLIGDESSKEAAVVDIGWDTENIIQIAESSNLKIKKIILTHYHYDHIQQVNQLIEKTNADVYYPELDEEEIKKVLQNDKTKHIKLNDSDEIDIGKIKIKVIQTPGHTKGSICLLFNDKLITGDTLFIGAIGRTDLPGGDALELFESLKKLKKLDDKVEIFPGHDYGQTKSAAIGQEKINNPYFKCRTKEEFLNFIGIS